MFTYFTKLWAHTAVWLTKKLSVLLFFFFKYDNEKPQLASSSLILSDLVRVPNPFAFHIQTPSLLRIRLLHVKCTGVWMHFFHEDMYVCLS